MAMEQDTIDCNYNYVVTAHKPTAVTQAAVGSFTGISDVNLIVAKSSRLEIHKLAQEGLKGMIDVPVYGRISLLRLFRPKNFKKDLLFLLTERYQFCALEYTNEGELHTRANGDLSDKIGRPTESGHIGIVDPSTSMIVLHLYDGRLKIIPMNEEGELSQAFNVRLEELKVHDIAFLNDAHVPTVAILYEDTKGQRHVKTYEISIASQELSPGPWSESHLDPASCMLIPGPNKDGCIVIGEKRIQYLSSSASATTSVSPTLMKSYARVGNDGTRFLLSDFQGTLSLLILEKEQGEISLKLEKLGETSQASSLCYLDSGVVFVGSSMGDSQLVKLHSTKQEATGSYTEILDTMPNLGPIVDFAVLDLDRQGQGQIVACSGGGKNGSLRIVRNGIGFNEHASIELVGMKGIWNLQRDGPKDSYLILSFIEETRVLGMNMEDELDELEIEGLNSSVTSIHCADLVGAFVQVTQTQVRIIGSDLTLNTSWDTSAGERIVAAASDAGNIAIALSSKKVQVFEFQGDRLKTSREIVAPAEISCIDCYKNLLCMGLWDMTINIYTMSGELLEKIPVHKEIMARSVLMAEFDGVRYVLCGLADGSLLSFKVRGDGKCYDRKQLTLGTKQIQLKSFRYHNEDFVFAASDRPTVIHSSNGKLLYSNLNENEVNYIASFTTASFPDSLALVKPNELVIGDMDSIQKLHVRTVPLYEQPRRIAQMTFSKTLLVTTTTSMIGFDKSDHADRLRLIDEQTFDTLDTFKFENEEMACSAASVFLEDEERELYAVGSAFVNSTDTEPNRGKIRLFSVDDGKLVLVSEIDTKGAVYAIKAFQGQLLAGINSRVHLYRWSKSESVPVPICSHCGHTLALYMDTRGDLIIVGDLMKSLQLLKFDRSSHSLVLQARDFNPAWMSAALMLSDDVYLGAENNHNLFTVRRNPSDSSDEDRSRLDIVGQYHLGDFVNGFKHGSLVMKLPDSEIAKIPTVLYGTINGSIGIIASLTKEDFLALSLLQNVLRKFIKGVGGFDHSSWRSYDTPFVRTSKESTGFIDGDLLEQLLDLSKEDISKIEVEIGDEIEASKVFQLVEDLSRLH